MDLKTAEGLRCLKAINGVGDKTALKLAERYETSDRFVKLDEKYAAGFLEFEVVSYFESGFPEQFRGPMENPAIELTFCGTLEVLRAARKRTAVIGTRKASREGIELAGVTARRAVEKGAIVVSGMALGIDRAAHEACLAAGGITVAFIPVPFNKPSEEDRRLIRRIALNGCVVSRIPTLGEFNVNAAPLDRNHLVVEASSEVVVVQAEKSGGTMNAAGIALRRKRKLYALTPESTSDAAWQGNTRLLAPEPDVEWARKELKLPKDYDFSRPLATPYQ